MATEPSVPENLADDHLIENLSIARVGRGWTMQDVADEAGLHYSSIQRWETGATVPNLSSVHRWAEALGLELRLTQKES